jgi:hypothetical protein
VVVVARQGGRLTWRVGCYLMIQLAVAFVLDIPPKRTQVENEHTLIRLRFFARRAHFEQGKKWYDVTVFFCLF